MLTTQRATSHPLKASEYPERLPSATNPAKGGQEEGGERQRPHLQDTDTSTRVAGMAALNWFKSPMPAVLV